MLLLVFAVLLCLFRAIKPLPIALENEVNPEELGEYLEGDIIVNAAVTRNGVLNGSLRWDEGVVPFLIDDAHLRDSREMIVDAMEEYHKKTCIRFRPRMDNDTDYIVITNTNSGCWSSVGKQGGRQSVNLQGNVCLRNQIGTAIHELMHALGFTHEQNRYERDDYVDVLWENIKPGREYNFRKVPKDTYSGYGQNYDYDSVMHYSAKAFSKNGQRTIVSRKSDAKIGQRNGFSAADVAKINAMYNCTKIGYQEGEQTLTALLGDNEGNKGSFWGSLTHIIGFNEADNNKV